MWTLIDYCNCTRCPSDVCVCVECRVKCRLRVSKMMRMGALTRVFSADGSSSVSSWEPMSLGDSNSSKKETSRDNRSTGEWVFRYCITQIAFAILFIFWSSCTSSCPLVSIMFILNYYPFAYSTQILLVSTIFSYVRHSIQCRRMLITLCTIIILKPFYPERLQPVYVSRCVYVYVYEFMCVCWCGCVYLLLSSFFPFYSSLQMNTRVIFVLSAFADEMKFMGIKRVDRVNATHFIWQFIHLFSQFHLTKLSCNL